MRTKRGAVRQFLCLLGRVLNYCPCKWKLSSECLQGKKMNTECPWVAERSKRGLPDQTPTKMIGQSKALVKNNKRRKAFPCCPTPRRPSQGTSGCLGAFKFFTQNERARSASPPRPPPLSFCARDLRQFFSPGASAWNPKYFAGAF